MNCQQSREKLESGTPPQADDALHRHLRECGDCRDHAGELRVLKLLRTLPVRDPAPGFETRALEAALSRLPGQRAARSSHWMMAVAASAVLALAVLLGTGTLHTPVDEQRGVFPVEEFTVTVRPMQTHSVDVVLDSRRAVENATLTVRLDKNLMLENRPRTRELHWQTNLEAGGNKLSLPIQLLDGPGGELVVILEHGRIQRQLKVHVKNDGSVAGAAPGAAI